MSLSVGLEIEGVVLSFAQSSDPFPSRVEQQVGLVAEALNNSGLSSRAYFPSTTRGSGPNYMIWNVTVDVTVSEVTSESDADDSAFKKRFGFEVISPVFYNSESHTWADELQAGIYAINGTIKWKANRSTGLHVHIGRGNPGSEFTLVEVQKIAMFYCRFEIAMDVLHPTHRSVENENVMSNRGNDLLRDMGMSQIYQMIRNTGTVSEIHGILKYCPGDVKYDGYSDSRFFKVNFTSLQKHNTIEFRQHEGTTDPQRMIQWTKFLLKFVKFAMDSPFETIMAPGESMDHL
ncbi:putative amidoligase [Dactylonectria macrodidyma]|uniref:Amidoligase n=1 Tax=Dactylonectria macrodidyma TaxID=307937 RepID=A0A9P9DLB7_9HYPO|nr:putative amidoligase [Dactylonectria macrodidyma]